MGTKQYEGMVRTCANIALEYKDLLKAHGKEFVSNLIFDYFSENNTVPISVPFRGTKPRYTERFYVDETLMAQIKEINGERKKINVGFYAEMAIEHFLSKGLETVKPTDLKVGDVVFVVPLNRPCVVSEVTPLGVKVDGGKEIYGQSKIKGQLITPEFFNANSETLLDERLACIDIHGLKYVHKVQQLVATVLGKKMILHI